MQRPGGCHLQAIVVERHTHRATADRVIAKAQSVRQRFPRSQKRVERFVDALERSVPTLDAQF